LLRYLSTNIADADAATAADALSPMVCHYLKTLCQGELESQSYPNWKYVDWCYPSNSNSNSDNNNGK
jgi:hypothetical protein